jgi:hypothetical protein
MICWIYFYNVSKGKTTEGETTSEETTDSQYKKLKEEVK